jgi:hypothetical protein
LVYLEQRWRQGHPETGQRHHRRYLLLRRFSIESEALLRLVLMRQLSRQEVQTGPLGVASATGSERPAPWLQERTGLSRRSIQRLRNGHLRPRRDHEAALTAAAASFAWKPLRSERAGRHLVPVSGPLALLQAITGPRTTRSRPAGSGHPSSASSRDCRHTGRSGGPARGDSRRSRCRSPWPRRRGSDERRDGRGAWVDRGGGRARLAALYSRTGVSSDGEATVFAMQEGVV